MRRFILVLGVVCIGVAGCGRDLQVTRGSVLFAENCAICHGGDARGGGGANVAGLSKTPPDLTVLSPGGGGAFPAAHVLAMIDGYAQGTHAGRRMQPFADLTASARRRVRTAEGRVRVPLPQADLLAYLQTVQR